MSRSSARFRVALTFDAEHPDRPNDGAGARLILDALAQADAPATFFLQGRWAEANPDLCRRMVRDGHLVGSHSHYHVRMPLLTDAGLATDVRAAESVIRRIARVDPRPWFRLPFSSGATHARLIARLADLGYRHVGWHVEVKEWRARETARSVADRIVSRAAVHGDGAIVLLHTWPDPVSRALPSVLERLAADGAQMVRLDQLDLSADLSPIGEPQPAAAEISA